MVPTPRLVFTIVLCSVIAVSALQVGLGQTPPPPDAGQRVGHAPTAMPGMSHPASPTASPAGASRDRQEEQDTVMKAMSHEHMHMSAHMKLTELRPANPEDERRAAELVEILRASIDRYRDYHMALEDGYRIFLPNLPQAVYHFNNYQNGLEAMFDFDPAHPTSLLYKKTVDGYELLGAMYTAPRSTPEDELNERVPLSVARWHEHVNICLPQRRQVRKGEVKRADFAKFGPNGSITTEAACAEAGGRWFPVIFGWMVHVYPFEKDWAKVWAH